MTGKDRYHQAVLLARLRARRELDKFVAGEIDILPCSGDREREFIIAEFDTMQAEIDRQHAILRAAGLDGARGAAMLPIRQKVGGLF
jgi:hypothetical protein